jgi:rare lipoprotein A
LRLLSISLCAWVCTFSCASHPRYRTKPAPPKPKSKPTQKTQSIPKTEPKTQPKPSEPSTPDPNKRQQYKPHQIGYTSYYAHKFHGRPTASGEIFDMNGLSAAHRELPLGTIIRVTHLGNSKSVILKVNDRGPFVEGRILDLSLGAAKELDMLKEGVAKVMIEIVETID